MLELDWSAPLPGRAGGPVGGGAFGWTEESLALLEEAGAVFAADVIYDDGLTDAFMACARRVFEAAPGCRAMIVSTERRVNFSLGDFTGAPRGLRAARLPAPDGRVPHPDTTLG